MVAFAGMLWMFVDGFSKLDARGLIGVMLALCVPFAVAANVIILKKSGQHVDLIPAVLVGGSFICGVDVAICFAFLSVVA